eukprot:XP_014772287.1 PREDICTED: uncharacterized protein LOC106870653 [Octopus bimaculoides]
MAVPTVGFDNIEVRVVMKFLFLQDKGLAKGSLEGWLLILFHREKNRMSRVWTGHLKVIDESWSGRPTSTAEENKADAVHVMVFKDSRISTKAIIEIRGISHERVGNIIHNILDIESFSQNGCRNT